MGTDFQFIAYEGSPHDEGAIARPIREHVPSVTLFRHAKRPVAAKPLHIIALYERFQAPFEISLAKPAAVPDDAPLADVVRSAFRASHRNVCSDAAKAPPGARFEESYSSRLAMDTAWGLHAVHDVKDDATGTSAYLPLSPGNDGSPRNDGGKNDIGY